jgi:alpha-L-fucosidase
VAQVFTMASTGSVHGAARLIVYVLLLRLFSLAGGAPRPTPVLLAWQLNDTGCFVHYNMATAAGTQGCQMSEAGGDAPPPLSAWRPTALDTDAWADTCKAMGGSRIILTAKHNCGFIPWHSSAVPNYTYTVAESQPDVVAAFVASARRAGLGVGFYYSDWTNSYCRVSKGQVVLGPPQPGQVSVTQAAYDAIVVAHLTELWSSHGALAEIWFDGGLRRELWPTVRALLARLQPEAVVFGGLGFSPNSVRFTGNENGAPPFPMWSTTDATPSAPPNGNPNGSVWAPAESPWTLQAGDSWFYSQSGGVHPPEQLVEMYEASTGSNAAALIDMAPYANGSLPAEQVAAASALGEFVRGCYGGGSAVASGAGTSNRLTIRPSGGNSTAAIDRIQLREDQSQGGQRVRAFTLTAMLANGSITPLCNGWNDWPRGGPNPTVAIGNKYLCRFKAPITITSLTLTVTATAGGAPPAISQFAAFRCLPLLVEIQDRWAKGPFGPSPPPPSPTPGAPEPLHHWPLERNSSDVSFNSAGARNDLVCQGLPCPTFESTHGMFPGQTAAAHFPNAPWTGGNSHGRVCHYDYICH